HRGSIMRVGAGDAVEKLVTYRLADYIGAAREQPLDCRCVSRRWSMTGEPIGAAAAGSLSCNVVHVLHCYGKTRKWSRTRATNRFREVMRNEGAAFTFG